GRRDAEGKKLVFLPDQVEAHEDDGQVRYTVKETGEPVEIQWDKMSKSKGNVVNPDEVVATYGADSVRMYEMFMGPLEQSAPWQTEGLAGVHRFLQRVHRLYFETDDSGDAESAQADHPGRLRSMPPGEGTPRQRKLLHKTIHEVTERIDRLSFNTAIASMM